MMKRRMLLTLAAALAVAAAWALAPSSADNPLGNTVGVTATVAPAPGTVAVTNPATFAPSVNEVEHRKAETVGAAGNHQEVGNRVAEPAYTAAGSPGVMPDKFELPPRVPAPDTPAQTAQYDDPLAPTHGAEVAALKPTAVTNAVPPAVPDNNVVALKPDALPHVQPVEVSVLPGNHVAQLKAAGAPAVNEGYEHRSNAAPDDPLVTAEMSKVPPTDYGAVTALGA